MSAVSSTFRAHCSMHSEKSAISLSLKRLLVLCQPRLARNQYSSLELGPTHASLRSRTAIMITTSNSSSPRSRTPNQLLGVLLHTMAISGLSTADSPIPDASSSTNELPGCTAVHSSRSSTQGSSDSARRAGIHVASSPTNAIARTTPASTKGSRGVA
jgi:hypothetical protein